MVIEAMALAQSKVTAQGQISLPAEIRRKLGIGPGSVLEWDEEGDMVIVRKAGRYSSEDIHRAIFSKDSPTPKKLEEFDKGVRRYMKTKHARR
jgi:antitoxin PrlF